MYTESLSMIYEATRQILRIDKLAPEIKSGRQPKVYCCNVQAVHYSYDNKKCVHAKHIMIKISFVLWKEKIQDQIINLEQVSTCSTANQRLTAQCVQRTTVDMGLW
jgi:hypothetical protein